MSDSTCSPKSNGGDNGTAALDALLARLPTCALSSIATISKGKTGIKDATPGQYPLVVTAEARGSSDYFDFEGPGVMIPMVSSTGHGDASLKRVHYQDGKYAVGSILAVVQPRDPEELSARYLHAYLSTFKDELLVSRMVGTANVSLTVAKISGVPIPLIPISAQRKIEELMALCDRLDARQADAGSAHAQLVQALLDSLTQARDAEDFAHSWQRLAEHFHTLFTTESSIDALKQTLLQLAVMGKLVPQDPNDEPASELLKRIAEEKARLVVEGKINKQKPLAAFDEEAAPFELPAGWKWTSLAQVAVVNPRNAAADSLEISFVPMTFIGTRFDGQHAQETRLWAKVKQGFTHFAEGDVGVAKITPCFENSKACVFSNLVNGLGAGTTELHVVRPVCQTLDPRYVLAYLKSPQFLLVGETKMTGTAGQKRLPKNFVETNPFPLPPLAEQHRIVAKVDELMALCDQLKARLGEARQVHGNLANALIGQALNGEKEPRAEAVYFSAYLISKLASRRTFGRVAHMKLLFLADSHLGLGLMDGYRRHAAGPLDTSIYRVEERAAKEGLYSTSIEVLKSGQEKVSYHIGANISRAVETAASALGSARKELDRLIALFEGRKTDDLEAVATLYAVWNDALAGGLHPSDEWLINEFRSNWHEAKERFTPDVLGRWLGWMRDNGLVPTGNSATTKSQAAFLFN
ncbi:restriction endonuclease subunit S [Xanthomonas oryzae pv. oryzicola]|uniref:restriction endonuclease subunit S n=1 Tax=Xanthomonas oryzae TaxID=347 RepID=UPI0012AF7771|nr:restriction endonuclease subunit S [Xanthomonas oryzae]